MSSVSQERAVMKHRLITSIVFALFVLITPLTNSLGQGPGFPFTVYGTIRFDNNLIQGIDAGKDFKFSVKKPDGTNFDPAIPATMGVEEFEGEFVYFINIELTGGNNGAKEGADAIIEVERLGVKLQVISNSNFKIGKAGANQRVNLEVITTPPQNPTITLTPKTSFIQVGNAVQLTVTLSAAQQSNTTVTISSANPSVVTVPSPVMINAGATTATFNANGVAAGGPVTITATLPQALGGASDSVTVNSTDPSQQIPTTTTVSSSANPSVFGQVVTLTATVNKQSGAGTPSGTVQFKDNGLSVGSPATLIGGSAIIQTTLLTVGNHNITAEYSGDSNFSSSTGTLSGGQVVSKASITATITSDSPDPSEVNQPVTVNYTVIVNAPGGGTPTGNVTVSDGINSCTGTVSAGTCTLTLTTSGNRTLTASYTGDTNFNGSTSAGTPHQVNQPGKQNTTTSLVSSLNPSAYGQIITFTATVSGSGTPTGTVVFRDGAASLGSTSLNSGGQAALQISSLSAGSHSITAEYNGDSNFNGSNSTPLSQTVNKAALIVKADNKSKPAGAPMPALTYTITGFVNGETASVVSGEPSITTTAATDSPAGDYPITVTLGTLSAANYNFTFVNGTFTITPLSTITTHPASQTACVGNSATFSVIATGASLTYQWRKNGTPIPGATDKSFTINSVTANDAGSYDVVVGGLTSNPATLTVIPATTIGTQPVSQTVCTGNAVTFSVAATGASLTYQWRKNGVAISGATNSTLTFASVISADAGSYDVVVASACGTVTSDAASLTVNPSTVITTQPISQTRLVGQSAQFSVVTAGANLIYQWRKNGTPINGATGSSYSLASVTLNDAGSYDVIVTGTCGSATSNPAILTVTKPETTTTLAASLNPSRFNQSVTFTAIVASNAGGVPTGTVTFKDSGTVIGTVPLDAAGRAAITTSALSVGSHTITAEYGGDSNFNGSSSPPLSQTVNKALTSITLASSLNPSDFGQAVSFTATITSDAGAPSGTVTFKDGGVLLGTVPLASGRAVLSTSTLAAGDHSRIRRGREL
jgi:hypothetical protein